MELLAHRGYWKKTAEKNTPAANEQALLNGWGIETDLRDYQQQIVICHDIAQNADYTFQQLLQQYKTAKSTACLALNIKADGQSQIIKDLLHGEGINNYFVFDMSLPEAVRYFALGMNVFISYSDYQVPGEAMLAKSKGIWLDAFKDIWYTPQFIKLQRNNGKQVAIVSPELHQREFEAFWHQLKTAEIHKDEGVFLCTDFPDQAKDFFEL